MALSVRKKPLEISHLGEVNPNLVEVRANSLVSVQDLTMKMEVTIREEMVQLRRNPVQVVANSLTCLHLPKLVSVRKKRRERPDLLLSSQPSVEKPTSPVLVDPN